jgi:hypothetical protein
MRSSAVSSPSKTTTGLTPSRSPHALTSSTSSSRPMFGHCERRTFSASTKTEGADSAAPTEVVPALPPRPVGFRPLVELRSRG